jgi:hypothetical protein
MIFACCERQKKHSNDNSKNEEVLMKNSIISAFLLIVFISAAPSFADTWLDEVILFDQPDGSSIEANDPTYALGPIDNNYVAIDTPETLILAFTDNSAYDRAGNDLRIREYGNDGARANVYASANGSDWVFLLEAIGSGSGTGNYTDIFVDLDGFGLNYVNYLKFEGLDNLGSAAGFDLDAVEALNSGAHVPIPGAIWLLGSGLIGLFTLKKRFRK